MIGVRGKRTYGSIRSAAGTSGSARAALTGAAGLLWRALSGTSALQAMCAIVLVSSVAAGAKDILIADFEGAGYGDWKATGDAFGSRPARGMLSGQQAVIGFQGKGLVNTFLKSDGSMGTLTSRPFKIQRRHINFLIGGGDHAGRTCVNLLIGKKAVLSATGSNSERLAWTTWNVAKFIGKTARIRIVDLEIGGWGHINVDHIYQSDRPRTKASAGRPPPGASVAASTSAREQLKEHGVKDIIFTVRKVDGDGHWYANFSYWSNNPRRKLYHDGGRLCRLNVETGKVTAIIDDPKGGVRDPQMHYDGRKILFSYRKGGQPFYHMYEINVDGTGLRQLTDGPQDDIEPIYLPDGAIIFCSSRCQRWVQCYFVRVAVLYRCDGDGRNVRQLSANIEQDNTPWVMPDGRILYMRWEYVDRSQVRYHHLWTMYPDGTNQMVYYGNMHGSVVMIDAKPIPGTNKVVSSFSPGHGRKEHAGVITIVDPGAGPDARPFARPVGGNRRHFRDPYPLSEDCFLVAGDAKADTQLFVLDGRGGVATLYGLPESDRRAGLKIHEPRPIKPRAPERVVPPRVKPETSTGRVALADITKGRNMAGVKPGEIKKLLVLETLPKPVNFSGGMEPLSMGGTFTLERILGTVPVEADGSAYFQLPAMRALFFVALDENDMAVKRMQSFLTVQPGEVFSCVGCHEQRTTTMLPKRNLAALARAPSRIEPIADVPEVIDFPRDIQPILDKHCVGCHGYDKTAKGGPMTKGVILTGDRGPRYSHSYVTLTLRRQFADGRNANGNRPPRSIGSSASPLMKKLDGAHNRVKVSAREKKLVRLWIESGAAYPGTYAALGSGMVGAHFPHAQVHKRCAPCHKNDGKRRTITFKTHKEQLLNLTRPEKSIVLLAPLAKAAGGHGLCKPRKGKPAGTKAGAVFANTSDPQYKAILAAASNAKAHLDKVKRFDMPGFRPNEHYVREMKFYGILPKALGPNSPIDVYETDRKYWRSLWYRPSALTATDRRTTMKVGPR